MINHLEPRPKSAPMPSPGPHLERHLHPQTSVAGQRCNSPKSAPSVSPRNHGKSKSLAVWPWLCGLGCVALAAWPWPGLGLAVPPLGLAPDLRYEPSRMGVPPLGPAPDLRHEPSRMGVPPLGPAPDLRHEPSRMGVPPLGPVPDLRQEHSQPNRPEWVFPHLAPLLICDTNRPEWVFPHLAPLLICDLRHYRDR